MALLLTSCTDDSLHCLLRPCTCRRAAQDYDFLGRERQQRERHISETTHMGYSQYFLHILMEMGSLLSTILGT